MDHDLMDCIRSLARSLGIIHLGVADVNRWKSDLLTKDTVPRCSSPSEIMHGSRSVISIGIPIQRAILATAPSSYYSEHYRTVNMMLDHAAQRIAMELNILGHPSVSVPRDGYVGIDGLRKDPSSFFSHRHSAYLAGMGTFGVSGMLITGDRGPRIRFTSVITAAELPYGMPLKEQLCTKCFRCTNTCPEGAVASGEYPEKLTDKGKCVEYSAILRNKGCSPCGRCIYVCPVGDDASDPIPSDEAINHIRKYTK